MHLDIKPANILLDGNMRACIADFGLVRLMSGNAEHTNTDARGTIAYMCPKFLRTGELSILTDMYSYGLVLMQVQHRAHGSVHHP